MSHAYTAECVDFLKGEFPGRVHLFTGDSREVLPWLVGRRAELAFDVFHVDGGHTDEICRSDMRNLHPVSPAANAAGMCLLDDVHASWIFDVYCEFVVAGRSDYRDVLRGLGGCGPQRAREDRVTPVDGYEFASFWHGKLNPFAYACLSSFPQSRNVSLRLFSSPTIRKSGTASPRASRADARAICPDDSLTHRFIANGKPSLATLRGYVSLPDDAADRLLLGRYRRPLLEEADVWERRVCVLPSSLTRSGRALSTMPC